MCGSVRSSCNYSTLLQKPEQTNKREYPRGWASTQVQPLHSQRLQESKCFQVITVDKYQTWGLEHKG